MRPSMIRTPGGTSIATGSPPRTSTSPRRPSRGGKKGCTTSSGEISGGPCASFAIPSRYRIERYASSAIWLAPSLVDPLRSTTRFIGSPLATRVRLRLDMSPRKRVQATTTRATTPPVRSVRARGGGGGGAGGGGGGGGQ